MIGKKREVRCDVREIERERRRNERGKREVRVAELGEVIGWKKRQVGGGVRKTEGGRQFQRGAMEVGTTDLCIMKELHRL